MCIGQQHLRLTIDGDGRRLNHGRRTATAAPRRCGATAGGDKHCYEDAKSNYQRAFKKHCIFSLNGSTRRRLKDGWKRGFASSASHSSNRNERIGTRVSSLRSDLIRTPLSSLHSRPVTTSYSWNRCSFADSPGTRRPGSSALIPWA